MTSLVTPKILAKILSKADLSVLPTSNPGNGKPWIDLSGLLRSGAGVNGTIPYIPSVSPADGIAVAFDGLGGLKALGYTPANDSDVVHKTGNETIGGTKKLTGLIEIQQAGYFGLDFYPANVTDPAKATKYTANAIANTYGDFNLSNVWSAIRLTAASTVVVQTNNGFKSRNTTDTADAPISGSNITATGATFNTPSETSILIVHAGDPSLVFNSNSSSKAWKLKQSGDDFYLQTATTKPFGGTITSPFMISAAGNATFAGNIVAASGNITVGNGNPIILNGIASGIDYCNLTLSQWNLRSDNTGKLKIGRSNGGNTYFTDNTLNVNNITGVTNLTLPLTTLANRPLTIGQQSFYSDSSLGDFILYDNINSREYFRIKRDTAEFQYNGDITAKKIRSLETVATSFGGGLSVRNLDADTSAGAGLTGRLLNSSSLEATYGFAGFRKSTLGADFGDFIVSIGSYGVLTTPGLVLMLMDS